MVEKSNQMEKPAEAGYRERGGGCCSALKHRASIAPDGARAEDGAGSGARAGGCGARLSPLQGSDVGASVSQGSRPGLEDVAPSALDRADVAPSALVNVIEVDVFWRLQGDGLGYIATTGGGESIEQEAPAAWSAPNDDPMTLCEWLAAIYPDAVIHWLGKLDRDDGCYGMQEVA